jgi:hypothetical protein
MGEPGSNSALPVIVPKWDEVLPKDATGTKFVVPELHMDEAGTRLMVSQQSVPIVRVNWWEAHGAEVAGSAVVVLAIALAWASVRAMGRPREAGRWYCPKCNYDVSGADGVGVPAGHLDRCPECGRDVKRGAAKGRARTFRRGVPLVLAILLVVTVAGLAERLDWPRGKRDAWPVAKLDRWAPWWPLTRKPAEVRLMRVWRVYDLAGGFRTVSLELPYVATFAGTTQVSPDGRYAAIEDSIADLRTGRVWRLRFPASMKPALQGFTADGRGVVHVDSSQGTGTSSGALIGTLFCTALDTRVVRPMGSASLRQGVGRNRWAPSVWVGAARLQGDPEWAMLGIDGNELQTLVLGGKEGMRTVSLGSPAEFDDEVPRKQPRYFDRPVMWFEPDGALSVNGTVRLAVPSGALTDVTPARPSHFVYPSGDVICFWRRGHAGDKPVGALSATANETVGGPREISEDGQWCAAVTCIEGAGRRYEYHLKVWEIPAE